MFNDILNQAILEVKNRSGGAVFNLVAFNFAAVYV